jgi:hypothetical protein
MRIVPSTPYGVPLEPIIPPMPTVFDGLHLWVFDTTEEYVKWVNDNCPPPPETTEPTDGLDA